MAERIEYGGMTPQAWGNLILIPFRILLFFLKLPLKWKILIIVVLFATIGTIILFFFSQTLTSLL